MCDGSMQSVNGASKRIQSLHPHILYQARTITHIIGVRCIADPIHMDRRRVFVKHARKMGRLAQLIVAGPAGASVHAHAVLGAEISAGRLSDHVDVDRRQIELGTCLRTVRVHETHADSRIAVVCWGHLKYVPVEVLRVTAHVRHVQHHLHACGSLDSQDVVLAVRPPVRTNRGLDDVPTEDHAGGVWTFTRPE